jgi:hypothetical protein
MFGQVPMNHDYVYPAQNRRINPIRTGVLGQIPSQKLKSAAAEQAEHLRTALRNSAGSDIQKLCQTEEFLSSFHPLGVAKACVSQHVRYNGTPFREAVRSTMSVLKMQQGDSAVAELVALLGAMIAQESDLTASQAQGTMWQDAATVGVNPTIAGEAAIVSLLPSGSQTISSSALPFVRPSSFFPVPLPSTTPETSFPGGTMTTLPGFMPGGGLVPSGEQAEVSPQEQGAGGGGRMLLYIGLGLVAAGGVYYLVTR